jgi:gamma-D-glutamyl-L-lysine dipeptidyl-peptidase
MKRIYLPLIALMLVGCAHGPAKTVTQNEIDSLCSKWVPVSSESICKVTISDLSQGKVLLKGETNLPEAKKDITDLLSSRGISYTDSITLYPDSSVGDKVMGIITVSVCNMREKPAHAAELISQAIMGTPVKILQNAGDWYLIQTPDLYIGWVDDDAVNLRTEEKFNEWKKSDRVICIPKTTDITDDRGGVVSDAVAGTILQVTAKGSDYYSVVLPDGREGRIKKSYVADFRQWASSPATSADELIKFGRTLLGTQYLWGGISCKGIDCSGFAHACYFSGGIIITRDAGSQALYGKNITITDSMSELQPGDLLFFGHVRDGKKVITHVGMYIGNGEVIHSSGMVKINSLDPSKPNYSKRLKTILQVAKRFLGEPSSKGIVRVSDHPWYF